MVRSNETIAWLVSTFPDCSFESAPSPSELANCVTSLSDIQCAEIKAGVKTMTPAQVKTFSKAFNSVGMFDTDITETMVQSFLSNAPKNIVCLANELNTVNGKNSIDIDNLTSKVNSLSKGMYYSCPSCPKDPSCPKGPKYFKYYKYGGISLAVLVVILLIVIAVMAAKK
jgi:hypothetical protein